ncbi:MAG: TlpA family protein disulfide reductase [Sphingomonadales bacterium]|nr:TlpA family protein disulfide reductase [Sphingomonadales bacterium]
MIADGPSANRPPHIWLEPPLLLSRSLKIAVLGLCCTIAGCDRQSADKAQPQASAQASANGSPAAAGGEALTGSIDRSHKGSDLPAFTFTDPAGKELQLQSLKGKPFLLNLWATWCAPCVTELPTLDRLAASGKVRVLTVSQDMGSTDKVAAFFAQRQFKALEPWIDAKGDLAFHYNAQTLPTTILYDAAGKEVWRFTGGHDWNSAETAKMLAEAGI